MSTIAGIWRFDGRPGIDRDCAAMLKAQADYGPHDASQRALEGICVGRRLFETLPEDRFDRQPVQSADGRLTLVADVRLDNREELGRALGLGTAEAAFMADTDIVLRSLETFGEAALERIAGEFALALWNARDRTLLLARDILGQRPLHYHRGKAFVAFATMPKGLHALSEVPCAPDLDAMADWLALERTDCTNSFFAGIEAVPPAGVVTVREGRIESRRYWRPARPESGPVGKSSDYVEGLRFHLDQAVRSCLRGADGAIGTHLSSGFDSAAVTATAARILEASGGKVVAFTSVPRESYDGPVPGDRIGDEGPLAAKVAALYPNIEHVPIRSGHLSPFADLDRDFALFERPQNNPCNAVWMRAINGAAQQRNLRILLIGQAGNMSLSYDGTLRLPELLRAMRPLRWLHEARALVATGEMRWLAVLNTSLSRFLPPMTKRWINAAARKPGTDIGRYTAAHPDVLARIRARETPRIFPAWRDSVDSRIGILTQMLDQGLTNKGTLAGWGIERRDPTADKRLIEFCLQVPMHEYLSDGVTKALARRALADRLPPDILNSRRRGIQACDWHEGVTAARADLRSDLERIGACEPARDLLDIERLDRLERTWFDSANSALPEIVESYRFAMLRGIAAGHFVRKALRSNR